MRGSEWSRGSRNPQNRKRRPSRSKRSASRCSSIARQSSGRRFARRFRGHCIRHDHSRVLRRHLLCADDLRRGLLRPLHHSARDRRRGRRRRDLSDGLRVVGRRSAARFAAAVAAAADESARRGARQKKSNHHQSPRSRMNGARSPQGRDVPRNAAARGRSNECVDSGVSDNRRLRETQPHSRNVERVKRRHYAPRQ